MNTLGSHPGAIVFRLSVMVIIILILIGVFLSYLDENQKQVERASILQTKRIIDSSLVVVFSTYAVKGRLNDLNQVHESNPFDILMEYQMLPPSYQGVIEHEVSPDLAPGWYYLKHRKRVVYKARFIEVDTYFAVLLDYQDTNGSGRFESSIDNFNNLRFVKIAEL